MRPRSTTPVTILTGFLGSGKSTLLNAFLRRHGADDVGVVINEFGDISIDHDLIERGSNEMASLSTGCICCTAGSDVRASLAELQETAKVARRPLSHVIVETTGLADLAPVINQIVPGGAVALALRDHTVARTFHLSGVVCTVDAIHAELTLERFGECLKQIAFADHLVITKSDMASDPATRRDVERLRGRLSRINPHATIADRAHPDFNILGLFQPGSYRVDRGAETEAWLAKAAEGPPHIHEHHVHGHDHHGHGDDHHRSADGEPVRSVALTADRPLARAALARFIAGLQEQFGTRLLRLKGLVCLDDDPDRPLVVQAVQHALHPPVRLDGWPSGERRTRIVVLGLGIDQADILRGFQGAVQQL